MSSRGWTDAYVLSEIERLRVLYKLKSVMRYRSTRDTSVHSESVAEHLFAMQVIAQYFLPLEDEKGKLDRTRIHELILFHELGEIETGDIINHQKTDEHREFERLAAARVAQMLPASMQEIALARQREFDECATPEARFADAIDKIEPIFEMWDEQVALPLFRRFNYTRNDALKGKMEATEEFPHMRRFIEAWDRRAVSLDVFPSTIDA